MNNDNYKEQMEERMYNFRKAHMKEHPLRALFLEITLMCNARCEHCGSSCGDIIQKNELKLQEWKDLLKKIADTPGYDPHNIMLFVTGGEPLVRKDWYEIVSYADQLGYPWGMTTNGILIDEDVVKKMEDAHMYSVSVSIDGLKETHESFRKVPGSFEKIIKGLKLMNKSKVIKDVQVTTCVNRKNIDQLDDLYELMKKIGIKNWRIIEVDPIGRAKENDEILLRKEDFIRMIRFIEEKERENGDVKVCYGCGHFLGTQMEPRIRKIPFICETGIAVASVLSNGNIFVCPDVEKRKELIQGNVRKDDFIDVWENKFKPFRKLSRTENNMCRNCPDRKLCGGDAFHTWDFDHNEPNFCIHRMFEEEYDMEKKFKKELEKKLNPKNTTPKKKSVKKKKKTSK